MRIIAKISIYCAIILGSFQFISCGSDVLGPKTGLFSTDGFYNGMVYKVFYHDSTRRDLALPIDSVVLEFAASLSDVDSNSILGRVNRNDSNVILSETFIRALRNMKRMDTLTGGFINMNGSDLKKRWGLNGRKLKVGWRAPEQSEIDSFCKIMNEEDPSLLSTTKNEQEQYFLENLRIKRKGPLDFSPIMRGLLVDLISEYLELEGIENYSVQVDQVIRTSGIWKKKPWKVGLERPDLTEPITLQGAILLTNVTMATSGFTRKAISTPAGDFLPILNPKTGRPVACGFFSYSVLAEDGVTADAFSCAFSMMGKDSAIAFAKLHNIELYYQERGEDELFTSLSTLGNSRKILPPDSLGFSTLFR